MKLVQKAIIQKDDKYLILLRSPDAKAFPEHWDFPGGKLEPNEEPFSGIEREVVEETNLKIKAIDIIGVYEMELNKQEEKIPLRFTIYSTKILSGEIKLSQEHLEFKWATKEEILQMRIEPYMKLYFTEHP